MKRLSEDDTKKIHAALTAAEAQTRARFSCVVLPASDRYALYPLLWGAMMAFAAGAIVALLPWHIPLRTGIVAEAAVFAVFALVSDWFPLRLLLVPRHIKREHAHNFAHREFAARILSPADHREGVLLFVSLGERYVEIQATPEVHAKLGAETWNRIVAEFIAAAGEGRIVEGAIAAIGAVAAPLAQHFPKSV